MLFRSHWNIIFYLMVAMVGALYLIRTFFLCMEFFGHFSHSIHLVRRDGICKFLMNYMEGNERNTDTKKFLLWINKM